MKQTGRKRSRVAIAIYNKYKKRRNINFEKTAYKIAFACPLYSWKYYEDKKLFRKIKPGDICQLIPEPYNKYDENAVILNLYGQKIGYVPRNYSKLVSELIDRQEEIYVVISDVESEEDIDHRIKIDIITDNEIAKSLELDSGFFVGLNIIFKVKRENKKITKYIKNKKGLTEFPLKILEHTELKKLDLSQNQLGSIPSELGELENLEVLKLRDNKLESLPDNLLKLKNLVEVNLTDNPFMERKLCYSYFNSFNFEIFWDYNQKYFSVDFHSFDGNHLQATGKNYYEVCCNFGKALEGFRKTYAKETRSIYIAEQLEFYVFRNNILKIAGDKKLGDLIELVIMAPVDKKMDIARRLEHSIRQKNYNIPRHLVFNSIITDNWSSKEDFLNNLNRGWTSIEEFWQFGKEEKVLQIHHHSEEDIFSQQDVKVTFSTLNYFNDIHLLEVSGKDKGKFKGKGIKEIFEKLGEYLEKEYQEWLKDNLPASQRDPLSVILKEKEKYTRTELCKLKIDHSGNFVFTLSEFTSTEGTVYMLEADAGYSTRKSLKPYYIITLLDIEKVFYHLKQVPKGKIKRDFLGLDGEDLTLTFKSGEKFRTVNWWSDSVPHNWVHLVRGKNEILRIVTDYTSITDDDLIARY